jgi:hypothetical protein
VKSVEVSLCTMAAKFEAELASLAVLQQRQHMFLGGTGAGRSVVWAGKVGKAGFRVSERSPRSLSADSNRPRKRQRGLLSSVAANLLIYVGVPLMIYSVILRWLIRN